MELIHVELRQGQLPLYASFAPKQVMSRAMPALQETLRELYLDSFPECLKSADLGCSSGPNALLFLREMIDSIDAIRKKLNKTEPTFQIFLNDLFNNDFNNLIRSIPSFYEELRREKGGDFGPCFIAAMPGNFYGRLFLDHSLHFIHSSYSVHWRSQVSYEFGSPLNKGHIYLARITPKSVYEAYLDLFNRDMTVFLKSRSEELVLGGRMMFTMIGRDASVNFAPIYHRFLLTTNFLVSCLKGIIEEEKLDDCNMPFYLPTPEEVRYVIQKEGSFDITRFETFKVTWDAEMGDGDLQMRGKYAAATVRAVSESILTTHFGEEVMDGLFERFASKVSQYMKLHKGEYFNILVSVKNRWISTLMQSS
ncbi:hypothetical protein EUGRSUZ_G01632 [Eucalyptus grandis]|uniref:Uncharacterized protein n=2 Tax=Eucalyptus grandis TaxID=71139 RepID=A0ACC3K3R4_EUCGR|nr:hypothetical protein EUGRSUZ_G01632 [Eucalyptus grandis]